MNNLLYPSEKITSGTHSNNGVKGERHCPFSLTIYTSRHTGKHMPADLQSPSFGAIEGSANFVQIIISQVVA